MPTTTRTSKTRGSRGRSSAPLAPTLGPWICRYIERNLVHGEGDLVGVPFKLYPFQKSLIYEAYELQPDGTRQYNRVLWGLPKGDGKTELAAAVAVAELDGPVIFDGWCPGEDCTHPGCARPEPGKPHCKQRISPDIPIAAASFEQADILFGAARTMIKQGPLADRFDVWDTEILLKDRPGKMYRVAAEAGTNDGLRPAFFVADEVHEWVGNKERVHLVISNGRAKRRDSWELNISTAGFDIRSLLGKMYELGKKGTDERLLVRWFEAPKTLNLEDPKQLDRAILAANPACGHFLPIENIRQRYREIPEHEFRRYHLNQWVKAPTHWMPPELWDARAKPKRKLPKGTDLVLGFDGSYNRDSTALMGCTIKDPHLITLGVWEKPEGVKDWQVSRDQVLGRIEDVLAQYKVVRFGADDTFGRIWSMDLEALKTKGVEVEEWPTRSQSRMAPACGAFFGALKDGRLTHDGDERLGAHIDNCQSRGTRFGPVIVKASQDSRQHIDLAVAAVIAYDLAVRAASGGAWRWRPVD